MDFQKNRKKIRIAVDIWNPNIDSKEFFLAMPYMFKEFDFVDCKDPDIVIASKYKTFDKYKNSCKKIFYTAEYLKPNMKKCDCALTYLYEDIFKNKRHFRLPNYVRLGIGENLIKGNEYNPEKILRNKKKFCAFVYWNNCKFRMRVFDKLSSYKCIDAPGKSKNNVPPIGANTIKESRFGKVLGLEIYKEKIDFLRDYKFVFAFENKKEKGYTTEKLPHAMLSNSIGLYWGNPLIHRDFNTKSFLNISDYASIEEFIDRIIEIDRNDDLYLKFLNEPWYSNNRINQYANKEMVLDMFSRIFEV